MDNTITSISEIQEAVKAALSQNTYFAKHDIPILVENAKDIEYQIKSSMGTLGIVASVSTPSLTYKGDYAHEPESNLGKAPAWEISTMNVVIVENPTLNRGRANYATALDTALQVACTLNPIPEIGLGTITQTTSGTLVIVNVNFKTNIVFSLQKEDEPLSE